MASWRDIMGEAEMAKGTMVRDRIAGEKAFETLLRDNPTDGMVYYKRGEAYSVLGEKSLAAEDFKKAEMLFPRDEWRARARNARLLVES